MKRKTLWVFYLAVSLVFVQGMRVHAHVYDHDPVTSSHGHLEQAHFHNGPSDTGHSDEVSEVDLSQQSRLQYLSLGSLVIAVFAALIVIFSSRLLFRVSRPLDHRGPLAVWFFRLRPPLRAPPL